MDPQSVIVAGMAADVSRFERLDPEQLKVRAGALAAGAIGLPVLREKRPRFGQWLARLETLRPMSQ